MSEVHEGADIIDSRDVISRIGELEQEQEDHDDERREALEGDPEGDHGLPWDEEYPDEAEELTALNALADAAGGCADWAHGEALISDDYFETYARELAEDIGGLHDSDRWPGSCIDWKQAAEELQQDYTSVEYGDTTYWIRS